MMGAYYNILCLLFNRDTSKNMDWRPNIIPGENRNFVGGVFAWVLI